MQKGLAIVMRVLGIVVLFVVFLASGYFFFFTDVALVRILAFVGVGLLCSVGVGRYSRITAVRAFGFGIEAAAEKAQADAEQIKAIRKEVEVQRDSIALITREANVAREQLNDVERLAQDANTRIVNLIEAIERKEQRARLNRLM